MLQLSSHLSQPKPMEKLSPQPTIHPSAKIIDSRLGAWTDIYDGVTVTDSVIGEYTYVCSRSDIMFSDIGKFCSIATDVRINPSNHPHWRVAQHHFTYRSEKYDMGEDDNWVFAWRKSHPVTIGHDVWIGHGAILMPGITVGTGASIGSGAVVTKDVPPYTVVAGVPAKPIKRRFSRYVEEGLLRLAWWDWPHERLYQALPDIRNLSAEAFLERYSS